MQTRKNNIYEKTHVFSALGSFRALDRSPMIRVNYISFCSLQIPREVGCDISNKVLLQWIWITRGCSEYHLAGEGPTWTKTIVGRFPQTKRPPRRRGVRMDRWRSVAPVFGPSGRPHSFTYFLTSFSPMDSWISQHLYQTLAREGRPVCPDQPRQQSLLSARRSNHSVY